MLKSVAFVAVVVVVVVALVLVVVFALLLIIGPGFPKERPPPG